MTSIKNVLVYLTLKFKAEKGKCSKLDKREIVQYLTAHNCELKVFERNNHLPEGKVCLVDTINSISFFPWLR